MRELALLFAKLGTIAFGGPAAHIAMMEEEVVKRRQWLTHDHFLDLLGATNLIPGPNSTEMAIHIGYLRAGWKGLVVAGACFILPAVTITLVFAHLYVAYGSLPQVGVFTAGIRAAIIAVIAGAVFRLGKPVIRKPFMVFTGCAVAVLHLLGVDEILLLFAAGAAGFLWSYIRHRGNPLAAMIGLPVLLGFPAVGAATSAGGATLTGLALFFLKIGAILYGSGYVLVAFLQGGLVDARGWLTQAQLLDAVAVGQFTPGPVLSTATFIGFVLLGLPGAGIATAGIFLPSFIFVAIISPFVPRLRKSKQMSGFLDGVNAASLGLMLAMTILLGIASLTSPPLWVIFLTAATVSFVRNVNAAWIVVGGAALGWLFARLGF